MRVEKVRLPNIRSMFIPDKGFTLVDADLAGADAQVVAWEADDEDLKAAFRAGIKIHVHNARTMWPEEHKNMSNKEIKEYSKFYKPAKIGCHACNYGATPNALVSNAGFSLKFAEDFRDRWFSAHPKIKEWHKRTERFLQGTQCWNCHNLDITLGQRCNQCGVALGRTVKNIFGFRKIYFDRMDGQILPQALAWGPQSTVAFVTELGWTNIAYGSEYSMQLNHSQRQVHSWKHLMVEPEAYNKWHNIIQFLIQVHDSIVFQVPIAYEPDIKEMVQDMRVIAPYKDPLIIPMDFNFSRKSWGECK